VGKKRMTKNWNEQKLNLLMVVKKKMMKSKMKENEI
jgi:hypothetical protein